MLKRIPTVPALLSICLGVAGPAWAAAPQKPAAPNQTVFNIPIGQEDVRYADEGIEELKPWGPAGFAVAPDGSFWIADTVGNRLVRYSSRGDRLQVHSLNELLVGATDVEVKDQELVVLGEQGQAPSIVRLNALGRVVGRYDFSHEVQHQGLSGIDLDERGQVLVVREGAMHSRVVAGEERSTLADLPAMVRGGKRFTVRGGDLRATDRAGYSLGYVVAGDTRIDVSVTNFLGSLSVLAANPDGSFYVVVEEVAFGPTVLVDQTVRHYGADGALLGAARVPVAERYTPVQNGLAVGKRGEVYTLVTRPQGVEVQRLSFQRELPAVLPDLSAQPRTSPGSEEASLACVRTRAETAADANAYLNLNVYLSSINIDSYCAGRGKPRYLSAAGYYRSMPYKWGGWDTGATYQDGMVAHYRAGDICGDGSCSSSDPILSCARGMDCSGFVTRVWRRTDQKYSTSTLPNISTAISNSSLLQGDILNDAGSHTVLFNYATSTGLYIWEATKTNSYDRVVYRHTGWSYVSGYVARRYHGMC